MKVININIKETGTVINSDFKILSKNLFIILFFLLVASCSDDNSEDKSDKKLNQIKYSENFIDSSKKYEIINVKLSLKFARKALDQALSSGDKLLAGESYQSIGRTFYNSYRFDSSGYYFQKALNYYNQAKNEEKMLSIIVVLGNNYLKTCNYSKSIDYYNKALAILGETKLHKHHKVIYNNLAIDHLEIGNYETAVMYLKKGCEAYKFFGEQENYIASLVNIGLTYNSWGKYSDGLYFLRQAENKTIELKNKFLESIVYYSFGSYYQDNKNWDSSIYYSKKALDISKSNNLDDHITFEGIIYSSIGKSYSAMDSVSKALKYFALAKVILDSIGHKTASCELLYNRALLYVKIGKANIAINESIKSLAIAKVLKIKLQQSNNLKLLSVLFSKKGNYDKAFNYLSKYLDVKDSIFNEKSEKELLKMKISYETEKKDLENFELSERNRLQRIYFILASFLASALIIVLFLRYRTKQRSVKELKIKNELISDKNIELDLLNDELTAKHQEISEKNSSLEILNDMLKQANATKDKFFLLLSHELLNPIKWTDNVTTMLKEKFDKMSQEEIGNVLDVISQSSGLSSRLLENLLTWSKIQTGRIEINPVPLNIKLIIDKIIMLCRSKIVSKNISFTVNSCDSIVMADENMLNIVLRNIIDNALKFTPMNGAISVVAECSNESLELTITDNGVGIDPVSMEKLFRIDRHLSTPGTENEKGTGFGLILCKEYIEMSGGVISVNSQKGTGTSSNSQYPYKSN